MKYICIIYIYIYIVVTRVLLSYTFNPDYSGRVRIVKSSLKHSPARRLKFFRNDVEDLLWLFLFEA